MRPDTQPCFTRAKGATERLAGVEAAPCVRVKSETTFASRLGLWETSDVLEWSATLETLDALEWSDALGTLVAYQLSDAWATSGS